MKKINTLLLFGSFIFFCGFIYSQENNQNEVPHRVILNLTSSSENSISVTWRTVDQYSNSFVEFAPAKDWIDFKETSLKIEAREEKVILDNSKSVYHYSTQLNNLQPNTLYSYRVGHDSVWTEWYQFRTADNRNSKFKFVFMGDPQNDIKEFVSRIFRQAYKKASDANFWLFTGDLTSLPFLDKEWNDFFNAGGFIFGTIPSVMVPGNHEYTRVNPDNTKTKEFTKLWRPHLTLPENGIKGMEETSYYFDYQGARFVMINGNERLEEQAKWMETILSENKNKWTIVAMHEPIYSTGRTRDNKEMQRIFLPLFDKYNVDLVLQGDDHTYGRTCKLKNGEKVSESEEGTIYVVSVSGPKAYEMNPKYLDLMEKYGEKKQLFQVITIDGNSLHYESYTAAENLYDVFDIKKK